MKQRYLPSLDGLRGYAVLAVILFHCHVIYWGWLGVQLFFTLSGFLITLGLITSRNKPFKQYLRDFYMRRMLRIFPLYYAFLFVLIILSFSYDAITIDNDWPYLFSYTYNIFRTSSTYEHSLFYGHLWSLSVEEQFYIFWPLIIFIVATRFFNQTILGLISLLLIVKMGLFLANQVGLVDRAVVGHLYFQTFAQADAFMFGALAASIYLNRPAINPTWGIVAVAVVGGACIAMELFNGSGIVAAFRLLSAPAMFDNQSFGFAYTVTGAVFMLCTLSAAQQQVGMLKVLFENRIIVYTGKISYGLYVFHYPIIHVFEAMAEPVDAQDRLLVYLLAILVTYAVAGISYRYFEAKLLALKFRFA